MVAKFYFLILYKFDWRNLNVFDDFRRNILFLKYVHMRGEINSNRYEISFRLKISIWWPVSSLLVFTWIEVKWDSKWYGFHICNFDQNEIWTGMRFSCEHNLPKAIWITADSLVVAFTVHVRLKVNAGMDFISVISTEMKFHFVWKNIM